MRNLIEHLKKLETKASPRDWFVPADQSNTVFYDSATNLFRSNSHTDATCKPADAALIAEMRNALPKLLETIERLERENATYQGVVKALHEEREKNRKLMVVVEAAKANMQRWIDGEHVEQDVDLYSALVALEEKE